MATVVLAGLIYMICEMYIDEGFMQSKKHIRMKPIITGKIIY